MGALGLGLVMAYGSLGRDAIGGLMDWHKALGVFVLVFGLWRVGWRLVEGFAEGGKAEFLSPDEAAQVSLSPRDRAVLHSVLKGRVSGTPPAVCEQLLDIADSYQAEELMLVTNTYDLQDKRDSFERVAKAMAAFGR